MPKKTYDKGIQWVFLCMEVFNIIKTIEREYRDFQIGEMKQRKLWRTGPSQLQIGVD